MLLIPCPHCGPRPEIEFTYVGEADIVRPADPAAVDDDAWAAFLHARANPKGPLRELWRHTHGCGRFVTLTRNTVTDRFE
jgi:sarcosine oxidase subunit delta